MPTVRIYVPAGTVVESVEGDPPIDQSAEVAALTAQVAQLTADLATRTAERDALQAKVTAAQGPAAQTVAALA